MRTISLFVSASILLSSGALVFACSNQSEEGSVVEGSTTEEVRDELHYVIARCTRTGEPLTDRGRGLESAEITLTLGKRGKKRAVTNVRAVVKTVNGKGEGTLKVVAGAQTGNLTNAESTFVFVGDEDKRGKLKIGSQSDALDYVVIARQQNGRSYIELGQSVRDPIANAVDCTVDPKAWRVTEDTSCINLLGGKDVKEKVIPPQCWNDLDGGTEPAPPPDAGEKPVIDAGPSSDAGKGGGKDAPKWPDPKDEESEDDESPTAGRSEPAPEDAGAKNKATKQEAGGCTVAHQASGISPGLFLLVVVALLRRRSVR